MQPALNADMDAYTNVEVLHFTFDQEKSKIPIVYIYIEEIGISIPIPIPPITPLQPPLGAIPPLPTNLLPPDLELVPRRHLAKSADSAGDHDGPGGRRRKLRGRHLRGLARRHALRRRAQRAQPGRRARRRPAFDGLYYVKSVTHKIKRGEYKQNFTLTRNGLVSTVSTVKPMTPAAPPASNIQPKRYYGKVSRPGDQQHRSHAQMAASWRRCRTCSAKSRRAGRCRACRPRAFRPACFIVPPIGSQVWIEFEQGDPDYPIWTGGFWGLVAEVPVLRHRASARDPAAARTSCCRPPGRTRSGLSDAPPTPVTGGIVLRARRPSRRDDRRQRDGNLHHQRTGRRRSCSIGPMVAINQTALTVVRSLTLVALRGSDQTTALKW